MLINMLKSLLYIFIIHSTKDCLYSSFIFHKILVFISYFVLNWFRIICSRFYMNVIKIFSMIHVVELIDKIIYQWNR